MVPVKGRWHCGWESYRRSDVGLAMHYGLSGLSSLGWTVIKRAMNTLPMPLVRYDPLYLYLWLDVQVEFLPDLCSRVTFVNFTVTRSSLQSQCLNQVLKAERPDVDSKRSDLLKLQGQFIFHSLTVCWYSALTVTLTSYVIFYLFISCASNCVYIHVCAFSLFSILFFSSCYLLL